MYDERFVTSATDDVYQQSDAAGFIRLYGLPQRVRALKVRNWRRGRLVRLTVRLTAHPTVQTPCGAGMTLELVLEEPRSHKLGAGASPARRRRPGGRERSFGTDFRLWPFDIGCPKAVAVALWTAGCHARGKPGDGAAGLDAVARRFTEGESPARPMKTCTR